MTGALFRERAEAAGANFVPFDAQVDFDYRHLEEHFPARARCRRVMRRWRWR